MFLEKCKYIVKEKRMLEYITDKIEISSDDSASENSNEEKPDEKNMYRMYLVFIFEIFWVILDYWWNTQLK